MASRVDGEPCRAIIGRSDNGERRIWPCTRPHPTSAPWNPPSRDGDSPVLPDLLSQIPGGEQIGTVTADGAYDTRRCHKAIIGLDAVLIIPIRRNRRLWKEDCPAACVQNETLRATRQYGWAFWKRWTGYHARNRIEAKIRCLKAFGERIAARDPDRQTAEIHIRIALMNRFNALGTAEIARVA